MAASQFQAALVAALLAVSACTACLITNCPKGGKRSMGHGKDAIRQCPRCGPAKMGHCYGADICCGAEIGCLVGTVETLVCQREQMSPDPCVGPTGDAPCGCSGKCAAPGVCCTRDSCSVDTSCGQTLSQEMANIVPYKVGNVRGDNQLAGIDDK